MRYSQRANGRIHTNVYHPSPQTSCFSASQLDGNHLWLGDSSSTKLTSRYSGNVSALYWISLEADGVVWSTDRVQLCWVPRLKIDVCPNPRLLPHTHSLLLPLSLRPKAVSKTALKGPGVPAHPIAHEKTIGSFRAMRGKPPNFEVLIVPVHFDTGRQ